MDRNTLEKLYEEYQRLTVKPNITNSKLSIVLEHAESKKGVLTVVLTSCYKKFQAPSQDIRYHQSNMEGGYSGRSLDTKEVTPFLKRNNFVAMSESGWLTRSLEQNLPYDLNYPGKIQPVELKEAFLTFVMELQDETIEAKNAIFQIFTGLEKVRERSLYRVARPQNLSIEDIIFNLDAHFQATYSVDSASRLPVLAINALLKCICYEFPKYKDMTLLPLSSHTSADARSGSVGDIEILDRHGAVYEAYEIKHNIEIDRALIETAREKILSTTTKRYFILSTKERVDDFSNEIRDIRKSHGCVFIINGVLSTVKYSLRYISDLNLFISHYADLMEDDSAIKYDHKVHWNDIVLRQ